NNLGGVYYGMGRLAEAETLFRRSLEIREKTLGPDHPDVAIGLNNLAELYRAQGRLPDAEALFKRALEISEKSLGSDHLDVSIRLNNLAGVSYDKEDWVAAVDYWRRSTGILIRRSRRNAEIVGGKGQSVAEQESYQFRGFIKAAHRLRSTDGSLT